MLRENVFFRASFPEWRHHLETCATSAAILPNATTILEFANADGNAFPITTTARATASGIIAIERRRWVQEGRATKINFKPNSQNIKEKCQLRQEIFERAYRQFNKHMKNGTQLYNSALMR
jgi:hypothetical protein